MAREFSVRRNNAKRFLFGKHLFAIRFPTVIELTFVFVCPFFWHMMRRMLRAGAKIHKERFVGRDLLCVCNKADCSVHQIFGQVISFFRRFFGFDAMIVVGQIGIILMRVAAHETIVAFEPASEGPAVIRSRSADLVGWSEMPFANRKSIVAILQQHLRKEAVLERDIAVATRITGRTFGDA